MRLEEIQKVVEAAKEEIWRQAVALGRDPKIYLHWTADAYDADYPEMMPG